MTTNTKNFCKFCHFESDYMHSHQEWRPHEGLDAHGRKTLIYAWEKIKDGKFTDVNQICLPCQTMRKFKP